MSGGRTRSSKLVPPLSCRARAAGRSGVGMASSAPWHHITFCAPDPLLLGPCDSAAHAARTSLPCRREPNLQLLACPSPTYSQGVQ
eukprot:2087790-Pyramimonas_sp.AAC.1